MAPAIRLSTSPRSSDRRTKAKVMLIFGTRPEAIKMAPVAHALRDRSDAFETFVVVTAQHRGMLDQVLRIFGIQPDEDLDIMAPGQSLADITVRALAGLDSTIKRERPDLVLVQGDTTTAFVGSLAAFYQQTPIGHVEAGLRTGDKYAPFPEEVNRHFIDVLADLCFAPTTTSKEALLREGTPEDRIFVTGNTVIDALQFASGSARRLTLPGLSGDHDTPTRTTLLVTSHRRENLGPRLEELCVAVRELAAARPDLRVIFPVHLNPRVRASVDAILSGLDRVLLLEPMNYLEFVHAMMRADVILTDSGGIQEEAPALGTPVLVARDVTERPEAIEAGTARLVGTRAHEIVEGVTRLLDDRDEYAQMQRAVNPYGDGRAAARIVAAISYALGLSDERPEAFRPGHPGTSRDAQENEQGEDIAAGAIGG